MKEYRILFVRRDMVGLVDLDSDHRFGCRVTGMSRHVEGEIVQFGPSPPDSPACPRPIFSSRIDPGYALVGWPELEIYSLPEHDPAFAPYYGLVQPVSRKEGLRFYRRAAHFQGAKPANRVRICRSIIEREPHFIEPYQALGEVEWNRGRRDKARKYLESGWKLAQLAFPRGFSGTFDGRSGQNTPVFRVGTDYAKVLAHFGRDEEALEILEFFARIDPLGGWYTDGLDLPILLRTGRMERVKRVIEGEGKLGPGEFIRALLFFQDGWDEYAIRAVISGLGTNPLLFDALLLPGIGVPPVPLQNGPDAFAYLAALNASLTLPAWRASGMLPRLRAMRRLPEFAAALAGAEELARIEDLNPGEAFGPPPWEEFEECFTDQVIEATVRAGARV